VRYQWLTMFLFSFFILTKITVEEPTLVAISVKHLRVYDSLDSCLAARDPLQLVSSFVLYSCVESKTDQIPGIVSPNDLSRIQLQILGPGEKFKEKK